ncbi:MAG: RNA-binding protein YhbY [Firmicutes bacterium]|nr:RNA-binding protein YhbY [candidate division NPL-UPA2 bacterium]
MISSKQRAYLRGLANTHEPLLHIGKGGLTEAVATAVDEALKARELVKVRVLKNLDGEVKMVATELAVEVNAELIQVIGRNFVLYKTNPDEPKIELPAH